MGFLIWLALGSQPSEGQYTSNFQTNIVDGTASGGLNYIVGSNTYADVLLIRNKGSVNDGSGYVGYEVGSSNNTVVITGSGSVCSSGITYSGRVLVVRAPNNGSIQDAAAFYTATPPSSFSSDVMSIQSASQWLPADCSGNPCNTNTLAETVSVVWTGCGTTATGNSVARKANADTNYAADWAVGTSSFGANNP